MSDAGPECDLRPNGPLSRCLPAQKLVKYASMRDKRGALFHSELQEYLATLAEHAADRQSVRQANLLFSFAELKYRMVGGDHCAICHAHVRHVLPVEVEYENGSHKRFKCLCTRCLVAEKASARQVTLRVGDASVVYTRPSKLNASGETGHRSGRHKPLRAASGH